MDRVQPHGRIKQLLALGAVLIALTAGYVLMLRQFNVTELPSERHFGAIDQVVPAGQVYLEPISIDALNDAMQLRAYVSPSISESKNAHSASDRDLTLLVSHDNTVEEVKLAAGDHIASSTFEVDLNEGSVTHYPFDSYMARVGVQLLDGKSSLRLPARITTWEGVRGYGLHTTSRPGAELRDVLRPDPLHAQVVRILAEVVELEDRRARLHVQARQRVRVLTRDDLHPGGRGRRAAERERAHRASAPSVFT